MKTINLAQVWEPVDKLSRAISLFILYLITIFILFLYLFICIIFNQTDFPIIFQIALGYVHSN